MNPKTSVKNIINMTTLKNSKTYNVFGALKVFFVLKNKKNVKKKIFKRKLTMTKDSV